MTKLRSFNRLAPTLLGAFFFATAGCAAPPCPSVATAAPPPPPPPAAPAPEAQPVVNVFADPGPPSPAVMRSLPELPRPSPNAEVKQVVGITALHLTYSSPGAKGRTVWGGVVPFGKIWRAGANAPTKLAVSHDFTFGGKPVAAGRYSLFITPTEKQWRVVLNKDPKNAGSFEHDPKQDVASVEVPATTAPARERLVFLFEDATENSTNLVLDWAGRRVAVPITVDTKKQVDESIAATLAEAWRPLFNAGRYAFDSGDNDRALALFKQSIGVQGTWWNHWWAAQTLAKQKQHAAAREHAQKALSLGEKDGVFQRAFAEQVKKALETWPKS